MRYLNESNVNDITVKILGKIYQVKCPANKIQELQDAAIYVDKQMRNIRDSGKVTGTDRVAVITALNVAYELLNSKKSGDVHLGQIEKYIQDVQKRIENVLVQQEHLELLDVED
ncbi:MAG: cell division protein ZapA [Gammaproteobacteria bacterium]|nr:cell division protein ZapA [Gammaproteobacteria bacterium]